MTILITIYKFLKNYPKVDNLSELLDSDVMVLPLHREDNAFGSNQSKISEENKDLNIKYYATDKTRYSFEAGLDNYINLGILIVSSIEILTKLAKWIQEKHSKDIIETSIYIHIGNNFYAGNTFSGNGTNIGTEIVDFKNKLK
jgi:hypothetical protein